MFHKNKAKGKTFFTAEELISKSQAQRIQEIFQESYKKQRSYEDSGIKEIEKPVFSPQKPTHRIHLRPLRKVQPYPKYISRVAEIYEKARFQKLYGQKEEPEDVLPSQFFDYLRRLQQTHHCEYFKVLAVFFEFDDVHKPLKGKGSFLESLSHLLFYPVRIEMDHRHKDRIMAKIYTKGETLPHIAQTLFQSHLFYISSRKVAQFGFYDPSAMISSKIQPHIRNSQKNFIPKSKKSKTYSPPDVEKFAELATEIFDWISKHRATTMRVIVNYRGDQELRYYRNSYYENEKYPLFYDDVGQLLFEISRGAFAWIVDSHYETPQLKPQGPYWLTIDLDPKRLMEYSEIKARVLDFNDFCKEIGIKPLLIYSGNTSFHFRFLVNDFPADKHPLGILLPKLTSFETYYRRRENELKIQYLRDAVSILTLAYNEWTRLAPVGCNFKKYSNPHEFGMIFDNRTGIHQGARVPGSWHSKSGRMCRVYSIDQLPESESELIATSEFDYVYDNPQVLKMGDISIRIRENNLVNLLRFTNNFYSGNISRLIYKERIFNA